MYDLAGSDLTANDCIVEVGKCNLPTNAFVGNGSVNLSGVVIGVNVEHVSNNSRRKSDTTLGGHRRLVIANIKKKYPPQAPVH